MIAKLFADGQRKLLDQDIAAEAGKSGTLRGGNTGMLRADGNTVGYCPALTYLRFKGISTDPVTPSRDLMFDAGRRNEDHWYDILKESWDGTIKRETEIPTSWVNTYGVRVTGRPDIILCDKDGTPVTGIELKLVSSLWTARDILFEHMPKTQHLMQAAHYSWQLGIPFELWYTSRADFAIGGDFQKNLFPKLGQPGSEHCVYAYYYEEGKINPKTNKPVKSKITEDEYKIYKARGKKVYAEVLKVSPFVQGYQMDIHNEKIFIKDAMLDDAPWLETIVNITDIKRYFDYISEIQQTDSVPKPPQVLKADGSKANYKAPDYCSLGELCCGRCSEKSLATWTDKVKIMVSEKKSIDTKGSQG